MYLIIPKIYSLAQIRTGILSTMREMHNTPLFSAEVFSCGKKPDKNEDAFGFSDDMIVLSDGATDKTGIMYKDPPGSDKKRSGGEIASKIVVETALVVSDEGRELVGAITEAMRNFYIANNQDALRDSAFRFAGTMVAIQIVGSDVHVTQVGDSLFRVNVKDEYRNDKEIDHVNAMARKNISRKQAISQEEERLFCRG